MPVILTNKANLPSSLVKAVQYDTHRTTPGGDLSVSQLIDSPRVRALKRLNTYEEDVLDRIWMIFGTAVHHVLERADADNYEVYQIMQAIQVLQLKVQNGNLPERNKEAALHLAQRLEACIPFLWPNLPEPEVITELHLSAKLDGFTVYGTLDRYRKPEKEIEDYKITSAWASVFVEEKWQWEAQQNLYAWLLRENGYEVDGINIIGIYKDWSKSKLAEGIRNYPTTPVESIRLQLHPHEKVTAYIKDRIETHKQVSAGIIPDCTDAERWAKPTQYAVMKKGRKTAVKLYDNPEEAKERAGEKPDHYVKVRFGESTRCEKFCPVAKFCDQKARLDLQKAEAMNI